MSDVLVKERPILFSSPMVKVILDGRKTMTRRIKKDQYRGRSNKGCRGCGKAQCPHGVEGDHLWVRETWAANAFLNLRKPSELRGETIYYRATYGNDSHFMWRPSIFMPRWASRITLEITDVRVERLNDISEEDAVAEGIFEADDLGFYMYDSKGTPGGHCRDTAKSTYACLWESINGVGSWAVNPWVWAISFQRVDQ